ncbi:protein of unknown function [Xenorhabdus bovienii]|uniref:Uncharacterized protein n=1 Tax=Xenorhabdus bovienii TaxID=40576 RepID=A0A0B6XGR0_XENBV|nr:protein of unknown function [Xenorhabdus bovienii]
MNVQSSALNFVQKFTVQVVSISAKPQITPLILHAKYQPLTSPLKTGGILSEYNYFML